MKTLIKLIIFRTCTIILESVISFSPNENVPDRGLIDLKDIVLKAILS